MLIELNEALMRLEATERLPYPVVEAVLARELAAQSVDTHKLLGFSLVYDPTAHGTQVQEYATQIAELLEAISAVVQLIRTVVELREVNGQLGEMRIGWDILELFEIGLELDRDDVALIGLVLSFLQSEDIVLSFKDPDIRSEFDRAYPGFTYNVVPLLNGSWIDFTELSSRRFLVTLRQTMLALQGAEEVAGIARTERSQALDVAMRSEGTVRSLEALTLHLDRVALRDDAWMEADLGVLSAILMAQAEERSGREQGVVATQLFMSIARRAPVPWNGVDPGGQ
ncbi:MAG: hypothetical protein AAGB34_03035 [Planctomycetota bacterium]